jgi:uncharacterized protein (DUF1015 family)
MDSAAVVTPPFVATPLRLRPFRAVMLSPARVGDPASARAFARPYRAVSQRLAEWEQRGHVLRDEAPALYLHEYTSGGLTVRGLVGALDISHRAAGLADRAVWPHEGIHPVQVEELSTRMGEMQMNPAPILLVHRGPQAVRDLVAGMTGTEPTWQYTDRAHQRHRIWRIDDPDLRATVDAGLEDGQALLADGHHRYAAYLRLQQQHPGTAWDRGLAMLVDQDDTPLFLGAIHRSVAGVTLPELREAARRLGSDVHELSGEAGLAALSPTTLVVTDGQDWLSLSPAASDLTQVEWLHQQLLPELVRGGHPEPTLTYHHTVEDVLEDTGGGLAVLLPAPDFDQVQRTLSRGRLLPEKATSFQPKSSLGVLMRSLRDEPADR